MLFLFREFGFWCQVSGVRKDRSNSISSYETTLPDFDGLAKIPDFVMPDLIRYPEYAEITGFRPSPE
jgi:hypothetical protein